MPSIHIYRLNAIGARTRPIPYTPAKAGEFRDEISQTGITCHATETDPNAFPYIPELIIVDGDEQENQTIQEIIERRKFEYRYEPTMPWPDKQ